MKNFDLFHKELEVKYPEKYFDSVRVERYCHDEKTNSGSFEPIDDGWFISYYYDLEKFPLGNLEELKELKDNIEQAIKYCESL